MIELKKSLVVFDLETTGVALSEDRIVDIAMIKLLVSGARETFVSLVDPLMPIPPESEAVHHISDEMVRGKPTFRELAPKILEFIGDSDLAGFGVHKFDIPMLTNEFRRVGVTFPMEGRAVVDALTIFHRMEPRNLTAAQKFYCGKELDGAHRAEADAKASLEVLLAQAEHYPDLPKDVAGLSAFCGQRDAKNVDAEGKFVWRNGKASFNFGKHRTLALDDVARRDPSYIQWLAGAERTTPELAKICRDALAGRFPVKTAKTSE